MRQSNPFDFRTIADVLLTIDYTALRSLDYRQRVVQRLNDGVSTDRSLCSSHASRISGMNFTGQSNQIRFSINRDDIPPNVQEFALRNIGLFVIRDNGSTRELKPHVPLGSYNSCCQDECQTTKLQKREN